MYLFNITPFVLLKVSKGNKHLLLSLISTQMWAPNNFHLWIFYILLIIGLISKLSCFIRQLVISYPYSIPSHKKREEEKEIK